MRRSENALIVTTESCAVVVLTFNSVNIIRETLSQAQKLGASIVVIDSGSTDGTVEVVRGLGCELFERAFSNYSEQRNWAIRKVATNCQWQLHLDADEVLDDIAVESIRGVLAGAPTYDAYLLKRCDYFLGRRLRFSGVNPWHLRLFRSGVANCESRLYDQHFVSARPAGKLPGLMHDKNALTLSEWIMRHNRWSNLEAAEIGSDKNTTNLVDSGSFLQSFGLTENDVLQPRMFGDTRERTRLFKGLYYRLPTGLRALSYFIYRYLFRLGFLDGVPGFYFAFFQAFWFRMLIDAKIYEKRIKSP